MNGLLFDFSLLLIFTTGQGLLCNHCESEIPEKCHSYPLCTSPIGRCFTYTRYEGRNGEKFRYVKYGCVDRLNELKCGKIYMEYDEIHITDCCSTEKCNGKRSPFPPANCTRPARGP